MHSLKNVNQQLRLAYERLGVLNRFLAKFNPDDPEPYGSRCSALYKLTNRITEEIRDSDSQLKHIQSEIDQQADATISQILQSPFFWFSVRQRLKDLLSRTEGINSALEDAGNLKTGIAELGWAAAIRIRQTRQQLEQSKHTLFEIHIMNIEGEPLEESKSTIQFCEVDLGKIPDLYFNGSKEQINGYSEKKQVIEAFTLSQKTDRALDELEEQFAGWKKDYAHVQKKISEMQQNISGLETTLSGMPDSLTLDPQKREFEQLTVSAQNLEATSARLNIAQIDESSKGSSKIIRRSMELDHQLTQSRQHYFDLSDLLSDVLPRLEEETRIFNQLANDPVHPVELGDSQQHLGNLEDMVRDIGPIDKLRDPAEVEHDLDQARKLENNLQKITPYRARLQEDHSELITLVTQPEIAEFPKWCERAHNLSTNVLEYAPENWPRVDRVASFPADIENLENRFKKLIPESFPESIPETVLSSHLNYVQNLANDYHLTRARSNSILERLDDIKNLEITSRERLENIQAAFNQIRYVVHSNDFLIDLASQESDRLLRDLQQVSDEMSDPQTGMMENKSKSIASIGARIQSRSALWLDRLNAELSSMVQDVSGVLDELNQIAYLQENAVEEAHQVVTAAAEISTLEPDDITQVTLLDLAQALKRSSEYWHACHATMLAFSDVAIPVFESYSKAEDNYQLAHNQFTQTSALVSGKRKWPPASITIEDEKQELDEIDMQWHSFRKDPIRAISLVSKFGVLSARYQTYAERISGQMERIIQDQNQAQDLENELNDLISSWQEQRQLHRGNAVTNRGIRELLDDASKELNQLKRQNKKGDLAYADTLESLRTLIRQLRYAQVMVDDTHSINVNGQQSIQH